MNCIMDKLQYGRLRLQTLHCFMDLFHSLPKWFCSNPCCRFQVAFTNIVTPLNLVLDNTTFLHPCVNFVWADTGENLSPFPFMSSSRYNKSSHFSILFRKNIVCEKSKYLNLFFITLKGVKNFNYCNTDFVKTSHLHELRVATNFSMQFPVGQWKAEKVVGDKMHKSCRNGFLSKVCTSYYQRLPEVPEARIM